MKTRSYGEWLSPVTAAMIAAGGVRLGDIQVDSQTLYWVESRPAEKGRNTLMRSEHTGEVSEMLFGPHNVRSRVHEYGGGAFCVQGDQLYFSNDLDRQVYRCQNNSPPQPLTHAPESRFADLVLDTRRKRLIAVREQHREGVTAPQNTLVGISLSDGAVQTLASGADFYSNPVIAPDGGQLAYLKWNHPNMPWDGTWLQVAHFAADGSLTNDMHIDGGDDVSIFQPQWSPDGKLYFVSDRSGWWNLYCWDGHSVAPLLKMSVEFGLPQWVFGMSTYAIASDQLIVAAFTQGGEWRLAQIDAATGRHHVYDLPFTEITQVRCNGGMAYFQGASPTKVVSVVALDIGSGSWRIVRESLQQPVDPDYFSVPESITFESDGHLVQAFYYPPHNPDIRGPAGEKPPLMVICHSGPTGASCNGLYLKTQYWTSRGFAVLDVNYRGSTGFGRAYREQLNGLWGIADVADCVNGAKHLIDLVRVHPDQVVISGGSAGGFTVLAALTFHNVFQAGCSRYGISDMEALTLHTHKFESRYNDRLIAPYPAQRAVYQQRSPLCHVEKLDKPVIFFQGREDKVVLPVQSGKMADALRDKGIPVAYILFDGEGHGFRMAETVQRALEGELYFYSRLFQFTPADQITPVTIDNLIE